MELIEKMAAAIGDADPAESSSQYLAQAALTALIEHAGGDGVTEGDRQIAEASLTVLQQSAASGHHRLQAGEQPWD